MPKPETQGLSSARLARLDSLLQTKYVDSGKLAGTLTLVARRGELIHTGVTGLMDRERNKKMREDTIFRIYSMTKPITSVAFMMLVEEGLVALDDPVHRFIPEWRDLGVFEAGIIGGFQTKRTSRPMRMIDLLRHTSGLTYGFQTRTNIDAAYRKLGIGVIEKSPLPLDGMIAALAKIPLEFSPGDAWNYSVSTDVLGYLVGKISGVPFETFLKQRIFEPLGMIDTDFHVPPAKAERFAACYSFDATGKNVVLQDDPAKSAYLSRPAFVSGGGGLVGTAQDYLKFCQMLLNGGTLNGHRFISPKTIALMTMNHLPGGRELMEMSRSLFSEAGNEGLGFGLGFATVLNRAATMTPGNVGEYFWGGAASTAFWIDPMDELIVIFMTQFIPSSTYPVRRDLRTLVYAAFEE
ncbi:MAG TPA: serine hydrolase domain-containing protein [Rhizomicrobium sp.]|nr:serine hydrolase domain-containing protein [Rhizomicrobium sp.]